MGRVVKWGKGWRTELVVWEDIWQLIGSIELVSREVCNHTKKAPTPSKGLFYFSNFAWHLLHYLLYSILYMFFLFCRLKINFVSEYKLAFILRPARVVANRSCYNIWTVLSQKQFFRIRRSQKKGPAMAAWIHKMLCPGCIASGSVLDGIALGWVTGGRRVQ
jgi:hypothetical protein